MLCPLMIIGAANLLILIDITLRQHYILLLINVARFSVCNVIGYFVNPLIAFM